MLVKHKMFLKPPPNYLIFSTYWSPKRTHSFMGLYIIIFFFLFKAQYHSFSSKNDQLIWLHAHLKGREAEQNHCARSEVIKSPWSERGGLAQGRRSSLDDQKLYVVSMLRFLSPRCYHCFSVLFGLKTCWSMEEKDKKEGLGRYESEADVWRKISRALRGADSSALLLAEN